MPVSVFNLHRDWLIEQWNSPNRTDHYLMSIACEVRRVIPTLGVAMGNDQDISQIKIADLRLKFDSEDEEPAKEETTDEITPLSPEDPSTILEKEVWVSLAGGKAERVIGRPWWEQSNG